MIFDMVPVKEANKNRRREREREREMQERSGCMYMQADFALNDMQNKCMVPNAK